MLDDLLDGREATLSLIDIGHLSMVSSRCDSQMAGMLIRASTADRGLSPGVRAPGRPLCPRPARAMRFVDERTRSDASFAFANRPQRPKLLEPTESPPSDSYVTRCTAFEHPPPVHGDLLLLRQSP